MNRIVQFPAQRVSPASRKHGNAPAEIVIFPGVRIERHSIEKAASAALGRKRRAAQAAFEEKTD
jgi:hypothetical protein